MRNSFAGKVIVLLVANPRKPGTKGYDSWKLITPGMTYEAYRAAGGRYQDLNWDKERGWVMFEGETAPASPITEVLAAQAAELNKLNDEMNAEFLAAASV